MHLIQSLAISDIRARAPTIAAAADRIGRRIFWPVPVKDGDGFDDFRQMSPAEWVAIVQLLNGLLTVFLNTCGQGMSAKDAAEWISNRPAFGFRRVRLRRQIGKLWGGSMGVHLALTDAVEQECSRVEWSGLAQAYRETALLVR